MYTRHAGLLDLLVWHRRWPTRYPFLLESVARKATNARYDILFACPGETLRLDAALRLYGPAAALGVTAPGQAADFLHALDHWWQTERVPDEPAASPSSAPLPFRGGWFVFLAYELAAQIEPSLHLSLPTHSTLPVACAVRVPAAVVCDHVRGETWLLAESGHAQCLARMEQDRVAVQHSPVGPSVAHSARSAKARPGLWPGATMEEPPGEQYTQAVQRLKRHIIEGDVFQVNLSRAWRGTLAPDSDPDEVAASLYARLRTANPAPFSGLARLPGARVVSSSPERLVWVHDDWVETRPIAGTHPRGDNPDQDEALRRELLAHPKERAEHIMLIDLQRNDLGRLCRPGTLEVDEFMVLETYTHVHHIVSNVRGRLRPASTPGAVIRAVFPGGTITGCPKVHCMAIIGELEAEARGAYTGSMGYLNRDGTMDLNILIRTLIIDARQISLRAGAGIVADSDPARELAETRAKARGLLLALAPMEGAI